MIYYRNSVNETADILDGEEGILLYKTHKRVTKGCKQISKRRYVSFETRGQVINITGRIPNLSTESCVTQTACSTGHHASQPESNQYISFNEYSKALLWDPSITKSDLLSGVTNVCLGAIVGYSGCPLVCGVALCNCCIDVRT